jgi:hypothetical protein
MKIRRGITSRTSTLILIVFVALFFVFSIGVWAYTVSNDQYEKGFTRIKIEGITWEKLDGVNNKCVILVRNIGPIDATINSIIITPVQSGGQPFVLPVNKNNQVSPDKVLSLTLIISSTSSFTWATSTSYRVRAITAAGPYTEVESVTPPF